MNNRKWESIYSVALTKTILLWSLLITCIACINNADSGKSNDARFGKWLESYGLTIKSFTDTVAWKLSSPPDEPITKADSTLLWYPSVDSSNYILSNYDVVKEPHVDEDSLLFYQTYNTKTKMKGTPMLTANREGWQLKDYYWYDAETVYVLTNNKELNSFGLSRWKVGIDSVWIYGTHKIEPYSN